MTPRGPNDEAMSAATIVPTIWLRTQFTDNDGRASNPRLEEDRFHAGRRYTAVYLPVSCALHRAFGAELITLSPGVLRNEFAAYTCLPRPV